MIDLVTDPLHEGDVVVWWAGRDLDFGTYLGEEKSRLRVVRRNGREDRVPPSRLVCAVSPATEERALDPGARAGEVEDRTRRAGGAIDVATVWELVREAGGDDVALGNLADLALGSREGDAVAAVAVALAGDGVRFVRRAELWRPREADAVEALLREREVASRRAAARDEAFAALAAVAEGRAAPAEVGPELAEWLDALERFAIEGTAARDAVARRAREAIDASGIACDSLPEGAFRLARAFGRFDGDDADLALARHGFDAPFPAEAVRATAAAAARSVIGDPGACVDAERREDRTASRIVTIDDERTTEVDDGLAIARTAAGGFKVEIHIADPSALFSADGLIDAVASDRATSVYLPDRKRTMLPKALGEDAASLTVGAWRRALTFDLEVAADGSLGSHDVGRTVVRCAASYTYDDADAVIDSGVGEDAAALRDLAAFGEAREAYRTARGAVRLAFPEIEARVVGADVTLARIDPRSPSRRAVTEAMVLAGEAAARLLSEHDVPAVYRKQAPPAHPEVVSGRTIDDPVELRDARTHLRRAELGARPGPHFALGIAMYAQATSPLRRYQDLATHRQIHAVLTGEAPPFDTSAMRAIADRAMRIERRARRAETEATRYWKLRYYRDRLEHDPEETGVVVSVDRHPLVELASTALVVPVPSASGASPGDRLRLRVERVNPRAELLRLRVLGVLGSPLAGGGS